jgi:hypothetical protein
MDFHCLPSSLRCEAGEQLWPIRSDGNRWHCVLAAAAFDSLGGCVGAWPAGPAGLLQRKRVLPAAGCRVRGRNNS